MRCLTLYYFNLKVLSIMHSLKKKNRLDICISSIDICERYNSNNYYRMYYIKVKYYIKSKSKYYIKVNKLQFVRFETQAAGY